MQKSGEIIAEILDDSLETDESEIDPEKQKVKNLFDEINGIDIGISNNCHFDK